MKIKRVALSIFTFFSLLIPTLSNAFEFHTGPFDLYLNDQITYDRNYYLDDPICRAIANRQQIDLTIETGEKISDSETKITRKRVRIDPYLFGKGPKNQLIIKGNIAYEQLLQEVTIKNVDLDKQQTQDPAQNKRFFSGWFKSARSPKKTDLSTIDVRRVSDVNIVEGSRFNPPSDLDQIYKEGVEEVICAIVPQPYSR